MDTPIMPVDQAAREHLQTFPVAVLAAVIRGDLDIEFLIRRELAGRGLDLDGNWIGFDAAARLHLSTAPEPTADC